MSRELLERAAAVRAILNPPGAREARQRERDLEMEHGLRDPVTGRTSNAAPRGTGGGMRDQARCGTCNLFIPHSTAACGSCGAENAPQSRSRTVGSSVRSIG